MKDSVMLRKVNHKAKAFGPCHHTLRPLFPGLDTRNDKTVECHVGKGKAGAKRPLFLSPSNKAEFCHFSPPVGGIYDNFLWY